MPKFNVNICPVCGSSLFSPFITCKDFFVTGKTFDIIKCNGCGLKITSNIEPEENAGKYYNSDEYISHSNTDTGFINQIYHLVRGYMLGRKRKLIEKISLTDSGTLLDIGAGTGFFLNEMKKHGWEVSGTEKSDNARNFAKEKFNLNINLPSDISGLPEKKFRIVTLWHVLEHIYDLNGYIKQLIKLMADDGFPIIAVPNSNSFDATYYKQFWAAYDVPRHIWHFSPQQIKMTGEKHGLILLSIKRMPLDAFYISILSEKYKKSKFPIIKGLITGKISWLISIFNYRRCSSLIYIFKKP